MDMDFSCWTQIFMRSLLFNYFVYFDVPEHLADGLFCRADPPLRFRIREYRSFDFDYRLIIARVRKQDSSRFIDAIDDLPGKMLLCGHTDYPDFCRRMLIDLEYGGGIEELKSSLKNRKHVPK